MIQPHIEAEIARRLTPASRVLDVGGAKEPSPLATHVLDLLTYDEASAWGQALPAHTPPAERWAVHDICSAAPFPYPDKYFDFVICGQTLEDVRDPVRVCQELSRIAKAGYVETPSPLSELTRGMDPGGGRWVGYAHHRWLVDAIDGGLVFTFKPHFLGASRRFHFPRRLRTRWQRQGRHFTGLLWDGELRAREEVFVVRAAHEASIEARIAAELGDTWPMAWARLRHRVFRAGVRFTDRLGVRLALRPYVAWIQRWT